MSDKHIETVNHLKKKLDKGVSFEKTMHILYKLQKIPISVQLLEETGIGYKLRELSKREKNNDVGKTAKLLIMAWKQFLKDQQERQEKEDDDDDDDVVDEHDDEEEQEYDDDHSKHQHKHRNERHHYQQQQQQQQQHNNMDSCDDEQQQQQFNGNNDDDDDDEIGQNVSDNKSEESGVSPPQQQHQYSISNNKKKHKKKKKSRTKENMMDPSDDERKEKKKDKKRKHRDINEDGDDDDNMNGFDDGGNNRLKYHRLEMSSSSTSSSRYMDKNKKCDNDSSFKYSNGDIIGIHDESNWINNNEQQSLQQQVTATNKRNSTKMKNISSTSTITTSNGGDMFSSMLNMGDQHVLQSTNKHGKTSITNYGRNNRMNQSFLNDDDQQQSSSSSSLTSNFDREMMQSLNLSANRYDPSLFQYYQSQSRSNNSNDDLDKNQMINMAGMKFKGRTQVYAGSSKVVTVPEVYRLQDICIKVLMNHVNKIYEVGDLPYFILKPVFAKCTVQQLRRIEHYNPQLLEDTDELWREFCEKEFKNKRMDHNRFESWRDFYGYLVDEREQKLKNITKNINSKQRQAIPERKTQQLEAVKTPREIRRRQERNFGTVYPMKRTGSSVSSSSLPNKGKPAPLMKKLLQLRQSKIRR
ncbi:Elongin-A [Dermatophagoides farinae]|uniref:Elongin-A n=1 Tax=Dermatophagoides farinae TaxID=6954 RepID=A0A922I8N2_DERFA|nr:Elongin-A [Dermatophagoides farinae]